MYISPELGSKHTKTPYCYKNLFRFQYNTVIKHYIIFFTNVSSYTLMDVTDD